NMLYEKNKDSLSENAKEFLQRMNSASKRMSGLINDLLNFSRLSRTEESFGAVDLNNVLAEIKNDFELIIAQKNATIASDKLPVIEAIPLQMNQLLYNLMGNALKFTHDDTPPVINISCSLASTETKEANTLPVDDVYYQIVFQDNGIGFNEEYSSKIFEIFQRLHVRSEYEGTGIGLALVNKIILNHRGRITAKSQEGKGASFTMLLPAKHTL
ncbi:MAG: ATP-binding protein, partial [Chitinophagaceae bacterium]